MKCEKKITLAFVVAVLAQTGGALVWAGSAAERIIVLERTAEARQPVVGMIISKLTALVLVLLEGEVAGAEDAEHVVAVAGVCAGAQV